MPAVPPEILEWRKRVGADRWDEMWEGVLHMAPSPNREHQDLHLNLATFLKNHLPKQRKIKVYPNINLASPAGWPNNFRIPDLLLVSPERREIDHDEYFEGAPDVVVEIESPGDESREKLPFYAGLGVPEVWIVHRDTKEPEVLLLARGRYEKKLPGPDGWVLSDFAGVELLAREGKLALRMAGDDSTLELLPPD